MSGIYSKWSVAEERSRLNMIGAAGFSPPYHIPSFKAPWNLMRVPVEQMSILI